MGDMGRVNGFTPEQIHRTRVCIDRWYAPRGWQCLPSCSDQKAPMIRYAQFWDGGAPPAEELWRSHPSGNVQIIAGRPWFCVVDVDGPEAVSALRELARERGATLPRTWISSRDVRQGMHLWFTVPPALRRQEIGYRLLWGVWEAEQNEGRGGWRKRAKIELLCDRRLVMAPPSIHPVTRQVYRFHVGSSPENLPRPAMIPGWMFYMDAEQEIRPASPRSEPRFTSDPPLRRIVAEGALPLPASALRDRLPLTRVVEDWGVRIASYKPNAKGWIKVYHPFREDRSPSAHFNPTTGRIWVPEGFPGGEKTICLFRLGVELGHYGSWRECALDLARTYFPDLFHRDRSNRNAG